MRCRDFCIAVLKSKIAVNISIKIMDAFVAMRHTLLNNDQLFNRIESIEHHQLIMLEFVSLRSLSLSKGLHTHSVRRFV